MISKKIKHVDSAPNTQTKTPINHGGTRTIKRVLIANRGEIACRIIQTLRAKDIQAVVVYSSADEYARHVQMADEAVFIGPAPASESYLDSDKIIQICKDHAIDAVHPGYGFLSENADFAKKLSAENIIFIGPPTDAIDAMGDKAKAKSLMEKAGVPLVPGYHGDNQSDEKLRIEAKKIGFPVLLKAVAGGGGKGMRRVDSEKEFDNALKMAKSEAKKSFGNDVMLVEKFIISSRHIEVQVFGDMYGNIIHLFERDCSVQRRHQKVIEEAPAFGLDEKLRADIATAAVNAAKAVNYVGAGTVEFILDVSPNESGEVKPAFYFMEMNTRLQVEHPVTEAITGTDLVAWQIDVAAGKALPVSQKDLNVIGHAIEVRLYAEDPQDDFLPQAGTIKHFVPPIINDKTVRIDSALNVVESWLGWRGEKPSRDEQVSVFYDPMIAKIITHGPTRSDAITKMLTALDQTEIVGIKTNRDFLRTAMRHQKFQLTPPTTDFIAQHNDDLLTPSTILEAHRLTHQSLMAIFVLGMQSQALKACSYGGVNNDSDDNIWGVLNDWRVGGQKTHEITIGDLTLYGCFSGVQDSVLIGRISANDDMTENDIFTLSYEVQGFMRATIGNNSYVFRAMIDPKNAVHLFLNGEHAIYPWANAPDISGALDKKTDGLVAPMPAKIVSVAVKNGDTVKEGDALLVLEAMKMEHSLYAPHDGIVQGLNFQAGDQVDEGAVLIDVKKASSLKTKSS